MIATSDHFSRFLANESKGTIIRAGKIKAE